MCHQKGKKVKTKAAMLLSRFNVENPKDENEIKAEPCPKPVVKAEPCQPPAMEALAIKVEPNSPTIFAPQEASVVTISDEDLLSSHSANVLNIAVDSSLRDEDDDYEEFPPPNGVAPSRGWVARGFGTPPPPWQAGWLARPWKRAKIRSAPLYRLFSRMVWVWGCV